MTKDPSQQNIGPQDGLSLVLFTNNHEIERDYSFATTYGSAEGIRIQIHQPESQPTPLQLGFDVPPGMSTSVALSGGMRERLPMPYTNCHERTRTDDEDYSITGCRNLCIQYHILHVCGCLTADVPIPLSCNNRDTQYCLKWYDGDEGTTFEKLTCEKKEMKTFNRLQHCRNCTLPCTEDTYSITTSQSLWPSRYEFRSLIEHLLSLNRDSIFLRQLHCKRLADQAGVKYKDGIQGNCSYSDSQEIFDDLDIKDLLDSFDEDLLYQWIRNNLLRVNIYFGDDINILQVSTTHQLTHGQHCSNFCKNAYRV